MKPFTKVKSVIASLKLDNIDTDMIIPKQFLKTITRVGLGNKLFFEMRFVENDPSKINNSFILNNAPFDKANILLCGSNFGCGSSREHAPWALMDFGISCVIAESFADIFYNNCFENGILPIVLDAYNLESLRTMAEKGIICDVDLESQTIFCDQLVIHFAIDDFKKKKLLHGIDAIEETIRKMDDIKTFEKKQKQENPWLWNAV